MVGLILRQQLRSLVRDKTLILMMVLPAALASLPPLILPWLVGFIRIRFGFDAAQYLPLARAVLIMCIPFFLGISFSFILLDERDQGIFETIEVTPLGLKPFLALRMAMPFGLSLLYAAALLPLYMRNGFSPAAYLWLILLIGLECPLWTCMIVALSRNKVQAMTVAKFLSTAAMIPLAGFFIHSKFRFLFAVFPTFWLFQAAAGEPVWSGWLQLIGVLYHFVVGFILWRKTSR